MTHANVPQNRERIFIVAFDPNQVKDYENFKFPEEIKLTKTIHDVLEQGKQNDKYYYSPNHPYYPELEKTMTKKDTVYQWRRVYVRENKSLTLIYFQRILSIEISHGTIGSALNDNTYSDERLSIRSGGDHSR